MIKTRRNQIKTQGMSQLAENLLNTAEERKRRRKEDLKDTSTSMMIECHKTKNQSYHNGQSEERKIPSRANENSK